MVDSSSAATFTSNTTFAEANTAYDGQDIVIDGNITGAIDGASLPLFPHSALCIPHLHGSLLLTHGAVFTHSPCTTLNTHKLDLTMTNEVAEA